MPPLLTAFRNSTHLGVKIRAAAPTAVLKPINIALLVDTSGSMEDERLDAVKRTLHAARALFCADDQLTMVTFDDGATVVADHLRMDDTGLQQFYGAVDAVQAKGSTNLSAGIEQLLVLQREPYDAVMVLTDGHINEGIVSAVGLRSMMFGVGHFPITSIGYGADHNRVLLRDLATASRGAYVFVDSESTLPAALGDMIGGLRTELYKDVVLRVPSGWTCCENDSEGASYRLGNIVPDRDYWVVFEGRNAESAPITLTAGVSDIAETDRVMVSDCQELHEQVLRCRVAKAIVAASDRMEQRRAIGPEIAALVEEFKALPEFMLSRPLVLRMQAQLVEILDAPHIAAPSTELLARMSSGGAYLSTQRGVSCVSDPQCHTFSSPSQRAASRHVQTQSVQ
jgi:hypothetical protein